MTAKKVEQGGFEVPEDTITLKFVDPSFNGLEVECLVVPLSTLTESAKLANVDPMDLKDEDIERMERLFKAFASALVRWNLTRKGKKVPATQAGVGTLDPRFLLRLIDAWLQGLGKLLISQAKEDAETAKSLQIQLSE